MDDNLFNIPIWTNTWIPLSQVCWYRITKKGHTFDGIKFATNITSNCTVDLFLEKSHGKFEHIQSDRVKLDYNQTFYILVRSSQWYNGKIDMILLQPYIEGGGLHYGYIILIVAGSIGVLVVIGKHSFTPNFYKFPRKAF